jgi:hypothetical protein
MEHDLSPLINGGIYASIPLQGANHVKDLWEVGKFDMTDPESGWFKIDKFKIFKLYLTGYKLRQGFFGKTRWYTKCGMWFFEDDEILCMGLKDKQLYIPYVGCAITNSIAEICPSLIGS